MELLRGVDLDEELRAIRIRKELLPDDTHPDGSEENTPTTARRQQTCGERRYR